MTTKTPIRWKTEPVSYGPEYSPLTVGTANLVDQLNNQLVDQSGNPLITGLIPAFMPPANLVDQLGNQLVDQLGNNLITGPITYEGKIPINWRNTGV